MLITFKSKAAADIIMYKTHAKRILTLLGKEIDRGVITAEETAQAIARLEAAIAESKNQDADNAVAAAYHDSDDERQLEQGVSFATRTHPLLEMLRAAHREQQFVMWGV
jgi:predicted metalloendopeptidase